MKRLTILAFLSGLFLASLLIAYSGAGDVLDAVADAGWATLLVVLARALAIAVDGLAWRFLFPRGLRPAAWLCVFVRWVRESVNQLLPVAQVGGDFIGARLLTFWRVEGAMAGASVIVDIAVQATSQFAFAAVGIGMLLVLNGDSPLVRYAAGGMVVAALALAGFFFVQRQGGSRVIGGLLRRLAGGRDWLGLGAVERLYERLGAIYANPRGVAAGAAIHMAVWFFGAIEVWVALHAMGHPVSFAEAIVIESLGQAVRGAAFAVPGALGVQEGGFIALCALFGVPAGPALALSLVKRVPDLVLGLPGLLAWQSLEGRRIFGVGAHSNGALEAGSAAPSAGGR
jgi:putative membrane protein